MVSTDESRKHTAVHTRTLARTHARTPLSVSPGVHLQPGVQLSGLWSVHPGQNVSTVDMDDFDRQVTHLTGLI